jgi:hypothetical protein
MSEVIRRISIVSRVVWLGLIGYRFFLFFFIWEILLPILMESARRCWTLYYTVYSGLHIILYYYYYYIYFLLSYFIYLVFRTHVLLCVRGGIVILNLFYLILRCDVFSPLKNKNISSRYSEKYFFTHIPYFFCSDTLYQSSLVLLLIMNVINWYWRITLFFLFEKNGWPADFCSLLFTQTTTIIISWFSLRSLIMFYRFILLLFFGLFYLIGTKLASTKLILVF